VATSSNPLAVTIANSPMAGSSTTGAPGVTGTSVCGIGVSGVSAPYATSGGSDVHTGTPTLGDGVYGEGKNGIHGKSASPVATDSGVLGENTVGVGVTGTGRSYGLLGSSTGSDGVHGETSSQAHDGVSGVNNSVFPCNAIGGYGAHGNGVYGLNGKGWGLPAPSGIASGVWGNSDKGYGVCGTSDTNIGVFASSRGGHGVRGETTSQDHDGVSGVNDSAFPCQAVAGYSANGNGVYGRNGAGWGSDGPNKVGYGVWGNSNEGYGLCGTSKTAFGVYGESVSSSGIYGKSSKGYAGEFVGDVSVTGSIAANDGAFHNNVAVSGSVTVKGDVVLTGADCAEQFDLKAFETADPGTVMVIDITGALRRSDRAYDRAVAGVVSGAGAFKPAIVLDRHTNGGRRTTIALLGKVYCKVDAGACPIAVGDLLTTSDTPGHAMKATDATRVFGAVIGKALGSLQSGLGLLPVLISMQ
jgi:hypothetical protein